MKRPFVPLLLFAVLALVAAPAAPAQEVERPPTELWDEFPLEATATPSPAPGATTPQATPSPRVVREPASDGMSPPALVALLIAAAGLGALAARTATRRLRPSVPATPPPSPPVATANEPVAEAKPAPAADPPPSQSPGNGQPKRRSSRPDPGTGRPKRRTAKPDPTAKRRAPKPGTPPSPTVATADEPVAEAKPAPAADPPAPRNGQPKRSGARPDPRTARSKRRTAKPDPTAREPKRRAPKAGPPPTSRPEREDARPPTGTPPERFQAATPEPAPPATPEPAAPPRPFVAPTSPTFDACRIRLHNRSIKAHFFAVPYDGGPVLARSPYFKIRRAEDEPGVSAPEALRALVDELTAAGWRQTSAGRVPWDLRFERATSAKEPAAPRRAR
jgi:hypothetical protein